MAENLAEVFTDRAGTCSSVCKRAANYPMAQHCYPLSTMIAIAMLAVAARLEQKARLCTKMGVSDPADLANTVSNML